MRLDTARSFAQLLRRYRQVAGLTQEELAERAGVSWRAISDLERAVYRAPRRDTLELLAEALALSSEERTAFTAAARLAARGPDPAPGAETLAMSEEQPAASEAHSLPAETLTFLVADVRGYTAYTHQYGDEAGAALALRFAALAGEAVAVHEGRVVEVRGDEVLAVFAAARRAVRAAADLLARCAVEAGPEFPLSAGIGLDAGEPIPVPGGYRGEAINVAARLCAQAGPGEALASEAVVGLARRVEGLVYEERGPLMVKGLAQPVRAWLVRAQLPAPSEGDATPPEAPPPAPLPKGGYLGAQPDNTLVAREAERSRLVAVLDVVADGAGRLLLLSGEPGVGKTRLAQEATGLARARGFGVLVGRCYEQDASLPFRPLVAVLTAAVGTASPALRQVLPQRFPELGRLLPRLLPPPTLPEGEDGRRRLLEAAGEFLQALAAETPLLIGLDDLQWADSASLDLLAHLARALRAHPVLLLGTYRDVDVARTHPLQAVISGLTRERLVEIVKLRGLPPDGTAALICAQFAVPAVSDALVHLVHERTEGNPFFIEEVLQALVEQGAIYRAGDTWERKEVEEIELPQSVRAVVGQRVERLGADAQEVLRVASVLGQEFELDLLLGAAGREEEAVLAQLDAAVAARLLEERRAGRHERYAFAHTLIAQVLYDEVPRHRLRRLHLQAGEALERARGGRPEAAAELARHFLAAGDEARASRYAILAGDHAAGQYANAEAVRHYETALELLLDAETTAGGELDAAVVRRKLGNAFVALNRTAEAVAALEGARDSYDRAGDPATVAALEREIGWAYQAAFDYSAAVPHLEAALRLWPQGKEDAGLARLLLEAARAHAFGGDSTAAAALAERGVALAERLGEPGLQAQGLVERSLLAGHRGDLGDCLALLEAAEPLARRSGARLTLFRVFNNRGEARRRRGELRLALADARQAVQYASAMASAGQIARARGTEAECCLLQGLWEEGRTAARASLRINPADPLGIASLLAWMAGDAAGALRLGCQAMEAARRRQDADGAMLVLIWLVGWHLELEDAAAVLALAPEAQQGATATGHVASVASHLAEAAALAGAPDAGELVAEAAARMEHDQFFLLQPQVLRAEGLWRARAGDLQGSLAALRGSAEAARQQDALPQLGCTLLALARVARAAGDDALASAADEERAAIAAQIGPEARALPWGHT